MAAITLVLEGRVIARKRQQLEEFIREARPYYESIGDVTMRFMWSSKDDNLFREIFEYATQESFDRDDQRVNSDPVMQEYLGRWRALLEGDVQVSIWNNLDFDTEAPN